MCLFYCIEVVSINMILSQKCCRKICKEELIFILLVFPLLLFKGLVSIKIKIEKLELKFLGSIDVDNFTLVPFLKHLHQLHSGSLFQQMFRFPWAHRHHYCHFHFVHLSLLSAIVRIIFSTRPYSLSCH